MDRKVFAFTCWLLVSIHAAWASELPTAAPDELGFDAERLSYISTHFQERVDKGELAGVVTLVARHGKVVHFDAVGYQDVVHNIPMETDTIFRIYSMTKPIASIALMMLYQDGKFQITDPLSKFIPEFRNLTVLRDPDGPVTDVVKIEREPTIQDALRHTSGFSHGLGVAEYDRAFIGLGIFRPETSLEEMMTLLSELPLVNQPGAQYTYSVGHDIALRLVEIISGMPADEFLEKKLFAPLEMDDTGYWVGPDEAERLGPVHYLSESGDLLPISEKYGMPAGGVLMQPWSVNSYTRDHEFKGGSIGLLSTAEDYWRFAQAIMDNGELNGKRIISPRILKFMKRNHLTDVQSFWPGTGMGLGFGIARDPTRFGFPYNEGTLFWGGAAGTTFWIDPVERLVVVNMTQHLGVSAAESLQGELAALVYAATVD